MAVEAEGRRRAHTAIAVAFSALLAACSTPPSAPTPPPGSGSLSTYSSPAPVPPADAESLLYVAPDGDDDGSGSEAAPFATIAQAASFAEPGTTVVVADGTYSGAFTTRASGEQDARITYVAATKWGARLVSDGETIGDDSGDDSGDDVDAVWRNYGDYVDIRGFDISGSTPNGIIQTGSHARLLENHVHGFTGGSCMSSYKQGYDLTDIDFIGNVVHDCGSSKLDHGIYPGHPGGIISNNIAYNNAGYGIHCWHNCNDLVITNNLVFGNGEGGIVIGQGDGPNYGDVAADDMLVANNIVVNNSNYGIRESGTTGPDNRYLNNNVFGNEAGAYDLQTGSHSDTVEAEPGFVNWQADGSGDYRLSPTSANIDAGTDAGAPETDIVGNPRPLGDGVDIGVYERP